MMRSGTTCRWSLWSMLSTFSAFSSYEICIYAPLLKMKSRISSLLLDYIRATCFSKPFWQRAPYYPVSIEECQDPLSSYFEMLPVLQMRSSLERCPLTLHLVSFNISGCRPCSDTLYPFVRAPPLLPSAPHPFPVWCRSTNCESET